MSLHTHREEKVRAREDLNALLKSHIDLLAVVEAGDVQAQPLSSRQLTAEPHRHADETKSAILKNQTKNEIKTE